MPAASQGNGQWLSVTEETILLHDGLLRVTDLVELPQTVKDGEVNETDVGSICFDSKDPTELSNRLLSICESQNNAYNKLLEYRLNALRGLWSAQRRLAQEENDAKSPTAQEDTITLLKKQGLLKEQEQAPFSTRIGLVLLLPLLQSQSRVDHALSGVTAKVLLNALRDCEPLSLSREPDECLQGLEILLCDWIEAKEDTQSKQARNKANRETAASALVALACAR